MNPYRGWEIYPRALYDIAKNIQDNYGNIPWFISENGMGVEGEEKYMDENGTVQDDYRIEFVRDHLEWIAKAIEDDSLYWRLQMFCRIPTDNLTVINFDDKVRRYDTVGQLITNFVNWRLKFYDIRKQHQIANIEQEIAKCIDISKFIDLILNEVIVLHKQSSKDVKQILTDNDISHEVLKIAVSRLTKDEQKKLADTIKTLKRSKKEIEQSNIVDTYYAEVESLKQTLLDNGYELPEVRHVTI
jgi:DNA gyrase/topoisomerase IV subunit A